MATGSRHIRRLCAFLAAAALFAPGPANAASIEGTGDADPARVAPQSTVLYLVADLLPPPQQHAAVSAVGGKLLVSPDPAQRVRDLVTKALREDLGAPDGPTEIGLRRLLGALRTLAVTSGVSGGTETSRTVLTLR